MHRKTIVFEAALIVGLAAVLALISNSISPRGIALFGQWDPSKGVVSAKGKSQQSPAGIDIPDSRAAKDLFDNRETVFVDARPQEQYEQGHIKGAVSFPAWDFESRIESFLNRYPSGQPLVVYCSGRECEDSHILARQLIDSGFSSVKVYIDGFPAWQAEGFPVE